MTIGLNSLLGGHKLGAHFILSTHNTSYKNSFSNVSYINIHHIQYSISIVPLPTHSSEKLNINSWGYHFYFLALPIGKRQRIYARFGLGDKNFAH
jgi:hypothetical protein